MAERLLTLILRLSAAILLTALFAVALPDAWMEAGHRALGMGELPREPLVGYLCRSIAGLYAAIGALTWIISTDLVRYRPLVRWWGWFHLLFGAAVLGVDLYEGMPWFWTAVEAPGLIVAGAVTLALERRMTVTPPDPYPPGAGI